VIDRCVPQGRNRIFIYLRRSYAKQFLQAGEVILNMDQVFPSTVFSFRASLRRSPLVWITIKYLRQLKPNCEMSLSRPRLLTSLCIVVLSAVWEICGEVETTRALYTSLDKWAYGCKDELESSIGSMSVLTCAACCVIDSLVAVFGNLTSAPKIEGGALADQVILASHDRWACCAWRILGDFAD
jgi:hypothetical protein